MASNGERREEGDREKREEKREEREREKERREKFTRKAMSCPGPSWLAATAER